MRNKDPKKEASIIDEIESQLETILKQKKEDVEKELQEKIQREQYDAKKRMEALEAEIGQEKEALVSFQQLFSEYDTEKVELKQQIKVHLDKAAEMQAEIEAKTKHTLEELSAVTELNQKLEALVKETRERALVMKEDLQQKYGIVASVAVETEEEEVSTHLERELDRLNQIKVLLESGENLEISTEKENIRASFERAEKPDPDETVETQEPIAEESVEGEDSVSDVYVDEQQDDSEQPTEGDAEAQVEDETQVPEFDTSQITDSEAEGQEETPERETEIISMDQPSQEEADAQAESEADTDQDSADADQEAAEIVQEISDADLDADAEAVAAEIAGIRGLKTESQDLELLDTLEKYRESEGKEGEGVISYFKNEENITLDGEYIIAAISTSVDEAKKLYVKLTETESPKDQFFVKQEIIRHQEAVRKLMLSCIRMCEKDSEFMPKFTQDILNVEVFKNTLEKVSMENWSNQEDFTAFDEYAKGLKDQFYAKITPPAEYLQSIIQELKIQTG